MKISALKVLPEWVPIEHPALEEGEELSIQIAPINSKEQKARFRAIHEAESEKWNGSESDKAVMAIEAMMASRVVGWRGFDGDDGKPIACDAATVFGLVSSGDHPYIADAINMHDRAQKKSVKKMSAK